MEKAVNNKNYRLAMMLAFFAAITLRILHFASSSGNPILYMHVLDERYYLDLGKGIASGHWVHAIIMGDYMSLTSFLSQSRRKWEERLLS